MPAPASAAPKPVHSIVTNMPQARITSRPALGLATALLSLMLAACAQQNAPGYYSTAPDSTLSDAQLQAQGRNTARAPSQIQLGFGDSTRKVANANMEASEASAQEAAPTVPVVRPLQEAKTFLGTVPCLTGEAACTAARITLTLAPSGEWRSRTKILDASASQKAPVLEQGCWNPTGMDPWRILLKSQSGMRTASLTFLNDNVLRINTINDVKPTLDYQLTRQADVDGIDEMTKPASLNCKG